MAQSKKQKVDPFKTRKTKEPAENKVDTITPPADIQRSIDLFREYQEQAKHFEAEATVHKDKVVTYGLDKYCERVRKEGRTKSFKILGKESVVNYIIQDSSAGLSEEDQEEFERRWGKAAAEEMIVRDHSSIRFDGAVLEEHYEIVVRALQTLPEEILNKLFKPMLMKASPQAIDKAKKYAKTPHELAEMIKQLRIKSYIK